MKSVCDCCVYDPEKIIGYEICFGYRGRISINDYRNPRLAESMKVLGYVNKFNRGIAKVKLDLQDNGNPVPDFEAISPTVFCVKLRQSKYWKNHGD